MKKSNTHIDFSNDKIHIFDVEIHFHSSTSGHNWIQIGKLDYQKGNKEINHHENINLFCNNLNGQSIDEMENFARKLHC